MEPATTRPRHTRHVPRQIDSDLPRVEGKDILSNDLLALYHGKMITLAASVLLVSSPAHFDPPTTDTPVVASIRGSTLTITGASFGEPSADSALIVNRNGSRLVIPSTAPIIESWADTSIVLTIDDRAVSGTARVKTADGVTEPIRVDIFEYNWFDVPPTQGTNAHPLTIAVGDDGIVWVNEEFHRAFQRLDPQTGVVEGLPIPMPPDPGPFASTIFSDHRTQTSSLGEDIMVDPQGRVWFTQGGGYLYSGAHQNHSRIVCFDPDAPSEDAYRVYNVPGDWNEVIGLAWDEQRQRMWFAAGGLVTGSMIASFDPEEVPFDNHFDFSESLDHQVCRPNEPDASCYRVYELENATGQVAHLEVDDNGLVWFTEYWGNAIGVLEPTTGRMRNFPLPDPIGESEPVIIVGSGPWEILKAPNGDIIFCEFFDSTIGRFDVTRLLDADCLELDADGRNPCIREWVVPGVDLVHQQVHSITYDLDGNLWFSQHGTEDPATESSLGFITPDWEHIVVLPSLATFPGNSAATADGVAVDPTTGDLYFCEFWRKRIGRLHRIR